MNILERLKYWKEKAENRNANTGKAPAEGITRRIAPAKDPDTYVDYIFEYLVMDNGGFRTLYHELRERQFSVEDFEACLASFDCKYKKYGRTFLSIFENKGIVTKNNDKYAFTKEGNVLEGAKDYDEELPLKEIHARVYERLYPKAMEFEALLQNPMTRVMVYSVGYNIAISALYDRVANVCKDAERKWMLNPTAANLQAIFFKARAMSQEYCDAVWIVPTKYDFEVEYVQERDGRWTLLRQKVEAAPEEVLANAKKKYDEMATLMFESARSFFKEATAYRFVGGADNKKDMQQFVTKAASDAQALGIEKMALMADYKGLASIAARNWKDAAECFKEAQKNLLVSAKEFEAAGNVAAAADNKGQAEVFKTFAANAKKKAK